MRYPNLSLSFETLLKLKKLEREASEIYQSLLAPKGKGKFYISRYGNMAGEFLTEDDAEFYGRHCYGDEYAVYES